MVSPYFFPQKRPFLVIGGLASGKNGDPTPTLSSAFPRLCQFGHTQIKLHSGATYRMVSSGAVAPSPSSLLLVTPLIIGIFYFLKNTCVFYRTRPNFGTRIPHINKKSKRKRKQLTGTISWQTLFFYTICLLIICISKNTHHTRQRRGRR